MAIAMVALGAGAVGFAPPLFVALPTAIALALVPAALFALPWSRLVRRRA